MPRPRPPASPDYKTPSVAEYKILIMGAIQEQELALRRIAEIDAMFEQAKDWGSWMVSAANERERLVNQLRERGHDIGHKNLARTASGGRVS